jgi:hypothetical protein
MITTIKAAKSIAGSLGKPSKMPGHSYGLPAEECQVGARLVKVKDSVCNGCYALKGFYTTYAKTVKPAQYKRLDAAVNHPDWVEAMVVLISKSGDTHFRWHDSGDIQSIEHLRRIVQVCERTPDIRHWLPTREYRYVGLYRQLHGEFPPNLVVRESAHMLDKPAPNHGLPTSTVVSDDSYTCPASEQNNECRDCRDCWDPNVSNVAYHAH